jgi:hypothetical protein
VLISKTRQIINLTGVVKIVCSEATRNMQGAITSKVGTTTTLAAENSGALCTTDM